MNYYSVKSGSGYNIYKSNSLPIPSLRAYSRNLSGSNLGADPNTLMGSLPEDSEYVGNSDAAEGTIVTASPHIGSVAKYVAIAAILYYIFRR